MRPADLQRTAGPLVDSRETSRSPDPKPPPRAHPPALRPWSHGASQGQLGAGGARLTGHRPSRFAHGQISRARRSSASSSLQVRAPECCRFHSRVAPARPRRDTREFPARHGRSPALPQKSTSISFAQPSSSQSTPQPGQRIHGQPRHARRPRRGTLTRTQGTRLGNTVRIWPSPSRSKIVSVQSSGPGAGIPCSCTESCRRGTCRGGGDLRLRS